MASDSKLKDISCERQDIRARDDDKLVVKTAHILFASVLEEIYSSI
jgi:hypothetical protein